MEMAGERAFQENFCKKKGLNRAIVHDEYHVSEITGWEAKRHGRRWMRSVLITRPMCSNLIDRQLKVTENFWAWEWHNQHFKDILLLVGTQNELKPR